MIIAVDGPAGAGKSTVCRLLARELGFIYLDTGFMYRALAWALIQENAPIETEDPGEILLSRLPLAFTIENNCLSIEYNGSEIRADLRGSEISHCASLISQRQSVRSFLTSCQRRLATMGDVVAEGRDMTTVVFPHAEVKVFLTAALSTRTERRMREYQQKGVRVEYGSLETQIRERDEADEQRAIAPLRPGRDTTILDTSRMGIPEVVDHLVSMVASCKTGRAVPGLGH